MKHASILDMRFSWQWRFRWWCYVAYKPRKSTSKCRHLVGWAVI